ncbi:hypothetical protein P154DRAFT_523346 [Amniculicola lignicola CBS 123094]|uniref:F-box domain-containing protein n=1 Tax=Amniculicola lignicola CBS 123094 TaxID=1392246 RepID=A0A6A5WJK1_9PLEO|nr:hypothetical protein P154DRAFT_523346 [Amniculicola lignicola CBS 123094]
MDLMPAEIIDSIATELSMNKDQYKLSSYAAVSRMWQGAIERITFRTLKLTTPDIADFQSMYSGNMSSRRRYLRKLAVDFELPRLGEGEWCTYEHLPDRNSDSVAFTKSVRQLFAILHTISTTYSLKVPPYELEFRDAYRLSDCTHSIHDWRISDPVWSAGFYELHDWILLPELHDVHVFNCGLSIWNALRGLNRRFLGEVASKLVNLKQMNLGFQECYNWGSRLRVLHFRDMYEGLLEVHGQTIREIRIDMTHDPPGSEHLQVAKLFTGENPFRIAFWHLSTLPQLTKLHLTGPTVISPDIFSPIVLDGEIVNFPCLQDLLVEFSTDSADGRWHFIRDEAKYLAIKDNPDYEDEIGNDMEDYESDSDISTATGDGDASVYGVEPRRTRWVHNHKFRSLPNPQTFSPLLLGAAGICRRLSNMRMMTLRTTGDRFWNDIGYEWLTHRDFEMQYRRSGTPSDLKHCKTPFDDDLSVNRVFWRSVDWEPPEEVQAKWQEVIGVQGRMAVFESQL